jgi:hypothetical protein
MPLVYSSALAQQQPITERHERARKIKPQLAEGDLVRVAGAHNQAEAEFIQGMLLEEGVPSTLRRAAGFDVPDFLAAGPRDILVPTSGVEVAHDVLLSADIAPAEPGAGVDAPLRILAGVLIAVLVVGLVVWLGSDLIG